jgi:hypothetical protein
LFFQKKKGKRKAKEKGSDFSTFTALLSRKDNFPKHKRMVGGCDPIRDGTMGMAIIVRIKKIIQDKKILYYVNKFKLDHLLLFFLISSPNYLFLS